MLKHLLLSAALVLPSLATAAPSTTAPAKPRNVVFILSDDPGYGDFSCYGATLIKTPNIDALAAKGRRFTDFHAAPCCTAARYALLTGQHNWRRNVPGVVQGDAPLCIPTDGPTLPALMKKAGYTTAGIGKWHLGLTNEKTDFNKELKPGPLEIGFDSFFGFPATQDRVPCVYFEDHRVIGLDQADPIRVTFKEADRQPDMKGYVAGRQRIGWMSGGKAALWNDNTMGKVILDKTLGFIDQNKDKPFFLYFASHCVHAPSIPAAEFRGKTGISPRADEVQEFDTAVGQVVEQLKKNNLLDDTLIIVSSDNGSWLTEEKGQAGEHHPNGPYRGVKFTVYEGGHRVPFIAVWPKGIPAGTVCDETLDFTDMMKTFAAMTGQPAPNCGPDSQNAWPVFTGAKTTKPVHDAMLYGITREKLAVRKGPWKLIPFSENEHGHGLGKGENNSPAVQLFNLADDPGESKNLASSHAGKVSELMQVLQRERGK